jgi:hypothetical protein
MNKSRVVFVTTVFVAAISGLAEAPPNHIDLFKFPATQLDDVVVPLPRFVLFFLPTSFGTLTSWLDRRKRRNVSKFLCLLA